MNTTADTQITTDTEMEMDMDDVIERYVQCWNEPDVGRRTELARAIWTGDGLLVDPLLEARGPEAIAAAIGQLQEQMPGHTLSRTTAIDAHHDHARFGWAVTGPDGSVALAGLDIATFTADGRLGTAIGFFGDTSAAA